MQDDLSSQAVPAVGDGDHVRGEGAGLAVLYADFTCPHCAVAYLRLRDEGGRVAFRHFVVQAKAPRALALACAAEAAGAQEAFWPFADALYLDQGHQDDPHLWARCQALGLDLDRFEADRRSAQAAERVRQDTRSGMKAGVVTTPAVFFEPSPGTKLG